VCVGKGDCQMTKKEINLKPIGVAKNTSLSKMLWLYIILEMRDMERYIQLPGLVAQD